jgi:plasmid stabilization system protein ParE
MSYEIRRSTLARRDIRAFARYLKGEAGTRVARSYLAALERDLTHLIAATPHTFGWFHETGAPYRAKLFKLVRTSYWIIYVIDDEKQIVEFVRFWNAAREPDAHGL